VEFVREQRQARRLKVPSHITTDAGLTQMNPSMCLAIKRQSIFFTQFKILIIQNPENIDGNSGVLYLISDSWT